MLRGWGERTTAVLARTRSTSAPRPDRASTASRPTLAWICFHVLQEYARHAGHLDIAVELAGGPTVGE